MADISLSHRGLLLRGSPIANFEIMQAKPLYDIQACNRLEAISLNIEAPDCTYNLIVDPRQSISAQILAAIPTCRILNISSYASIDAHIIEVATTSTERGLFCRNFGLNQLHDGTWVFVAGDEILGNCGDCVVTVHPAISSIHLASDGAECERSAIVRLVREMEQNRFTILPTFSYTLLCSVRSQITTLGLTTFPALYIAGQQGYGKTMLVSRYGLLYDTTDSVPPKPCGKLDANSTAKGVVKEISKYRNQVILIDDLAKGSTPSVQRERQKLMAEVLRFATNGSIRQTASPLLGSEAYDCQSGVAFTGEVPLTAASDLTRIIEVPLTEPMRGGLATDRTAVAKAFQAWMIWLLPHIDTELLSLKHQLASITGNNEARLETSKILLLWSTELFYRFTLETDIVDQLYYQSAIRETAQIFEKLLSAQSKKVSRIQSNAPQGNLCWYILQGYHKGDFHVVPRKKLRSDEDCIVEKDSLCIRTETLLSYLRGKASLGSLSSKEMTKGLCKEGVLENHSEKRNATKRIHGKRYLELPFAALQSAAKRY